MIDHYTTLEPISVCPPRYIPAFINGRGGEPGELFVIYFDDHPVGGGSPDTDIVAKDGSYRAMLVIGNEHDGQHTVSIRQGKRVLAEFTCWIGATPTIPPSIDITLPAPAR